MAAGRAGSAVWPRERWSACRHAFRGSEKRRRKGGGGESLGPAKGKFISMSDNFLEVVTKNKND